MHTDNNCCKLSIDYLAQMTSFCGLKVLQRFLLVDSLDPRDTWLGFMQYRYLHRDVTITEK